MSGRPALTLRQALDDVGWFWLTFTSLVSAPSILSLVQMILEHRFVDALQWIVDGYNDILAVVGGAIEPLVRPVIDWLNQTLNWRLELYPHWRPLFVVTMLVGAGAIRNAWQLGAYGVAVSYGLGWLLGALLGALTAGLAPLDGAWWSQGFAAAAPVAMTYAATGIQQVVFARHAFLRWPHLIGAVAFVGLATFGLAAGLSFAPGVSDGAGVLTIGLLVLYLGVSNLWIGLFRRDLAEAWIGTRSDATPVYQARFGLLVLGGFFAAALIVAADAIVRWLTQ
ncbi:MAG: hypothetical protein AB7T59_17720 [Hyphomonadaceae bacterium]